MTISTTASSVTVAGNGAVNAFNFSFIAGAASNIVVTLTTATSVETVLVQGTQYTLSINAAAAGQIWGVGGTVTYPLSGSPIPAGTYLTIQRIVPFTQLTSISNQGDFYPQAVERALDTLEMQVQQVEGQALRAIVVNPADLAAPNPLPIASVRAGQYLTFDSTGAPTVGLPSGTGVPISLAMQPVVEAATTGAALTAMGGQSGVFTNTQMNISFPLTLNGASPSAEFQYTHPGNFSTQALAAAIAIPGTSTVYDAAGIASYIENGSTTTSGTAGEFYARATVNGASVYALNPLVTDQNASGGGGVSASLVGAEFDMGAFNTASHVYGINMIGVFPNGTPPTSVGYQLAVLNAPWGYGWLSGSGSANIGIQLGSLAIAANSDGQPIVLSSRDASNTEHEVLIQAQHGASGANLVLSTPAGGVILNGLELVGGAATFSGTVSVSDVAGGLVSFVHGGTQVGTITTNGTSTAYNTTSDYRLKIIYGGADGSVIDRIKVYTGSFKAFPGVKRAMLLAHEVAEVAPWTVQGSKDAVVAADVISPTGVVLQKKGDALLQTVDHSAFVPDLVAKCQTLQAEVSRLSAIVAGLSAAPLTPKGTPQ